MSDRRHAAEAVMPDSARFLDPFDDRVLLAYYHEIARWHGYIRFLGLPHLRDNPDVPIDRLYVEPSISESHIQPERTTKDWPDTTPVLQAVAASQRLVLLGDPGSGKSTLVSWIAWQLTQPGDNAWTKRLGRLVPIPMILRDMDIGSDITWDSLLDAFLAVPVAKALNEDGKGRERLTDLFERGQAVIMLDGLDEIGSTTVRAALQEAVFDGFKRFPKCRWLLTSRIVGYEAISFNRLIISETYHQTPDGVSHGPTIVGEILADLRYVVPFSDKQIEQFSHNWYIQHEQVDHERQQRARELVDAIAANEGTQHLARIPNLLTLIALIYRISRWLPHGRAMLYDRIAEAYLESIDRFRGLDGLNYSLAQKKSWLAYVGFQMQLRRGNKKNLMLGRREILVEQDEVHRWIAEAMGTTVEDAEGSARRFLDYIARRSGLLLPRGEDRFGFMHLSFQEYFAACYLAEHVTTPEWALGDETPPGTAALDLQSYADLSVWTETLVLLFETLAEKPRWIARLADSIFGPNFDRWGDPVKQHDRTAAILLTELAIDRYAGLTDDHRLLAMQRCWQWEMAGSSFDHETVAWKLHLSFTGIAPALLTTKDNNLRDCWDAMRTACSDREDKALFLTTTIPGGDLHRLGSFTGLQALCLIGTGITDAALAHFSGLAELQHLLLVEGQITDAGLAHLSCLTTLRSLHLECTRITDAGLVHLSALTGLRILILSTSQITDAGLAHLSRCTKLKTLGTHGTSVTEEGKKRFLKSLKQSKGS